MKSIFELAADKDDVAVIKVNAESNLDCALHPYVDLTYDYISVTKGDDHIMCVFKKDGSSFDFEWGSNGSTLVCKRLSELKRKAIGFLANENHIFIGLRGEKVSGAMVFYNKNFKNWQLSVDGSEGGHDYVILKDASDIDEALGKAKEFVSFEKWELEFNSNVGATMVAIA